MSRARLALAVTASLCGLAPAASYACQDAGIPDPAYTEPRIVWPGEGDRVAPDTRIDISIDGVDADYTARLRIRVTADGDPVEGQLEGQENTARRYWWAPDAPWPAGAAVQLTVWLDDDEGDAEARRFTITDGPGPALLPLADVQLDACVTEVITERARCDDIDGCGCSGEPLATELRAYVAFEVPDNLDASRRGYRISYGFGATPEAAEAAEAALLYPGRATTSRNRHQGEPDDQQCLALRRLDRAGAVIDQQTICATPAARCDGSPIDADAPGVDEPGAGCTQPAPGDRPAPYGPLWVVAVAAVGHRARRR